MAKRKLKQREDSAHLLTQVSLLSTDLQDTVTGLFSQLFQEGVAVMKAMVLQMGVLWKRGITEKNYHLQDSHFFIILLCSPGLSYPLLLQKNLRLRGRTQFTQS